MKRLALLALSATASLAACSAGGTSSSLSAVAPTQRGTASFASAPYRMPLATGSVAEKIKSLTRHTQTGYGGVPTITGSVLLTDAPTLADGDQINLAITEVDAMAGGVAYPLLQFTSPLIVNVLDLQHSALDLGHAQIPVLLFDGIQIVVDPTQSGVVTGGVSYPSVFGTFDAFTHNFVPSITSAVYIPKPFDGSHGAMSLLVDFNAMESIAINGSIAEFGPVVRSTPWDSNAVIVGSILNAAGAPVKGVTITATAADGSVGARTVSHRDGTFELHGFPGGDYSLSFTNSHVSHSGVTIDATGADALTPPSIFVSVPPGYRVNVNTVSD